jgi:hypothetical protein
LLKNQSFLLTDIKIGTSFQEAHDLISKQVILCPNLLYGSDFSSYKPYTPISIPPRPQYRSLLSQMLRTWTTTDYNTQAQPLCIKTISFQWLLGTLDFKAQQ